MAVKKNYKVGRGFLDGRVFQIEFWDDNDDFPYVKVSEVVSREVRRNWFSERKELREFLVPIKYGWTVENRLKIAVALIYDYLMKEKERNKEAEDIEKFCAGYNTLEGVF